MNRTTQFGEGLFETILWRGETPKLRIHYERLRNSAESLNVPCPGYGEFLRAIREKAGDRKDVYVKLLLVYEGGDHFADVPEMYRIEVIVKQTPPVPDDVSLTLSPYRRHSEDPICRHKTTSYLFNILVRRYAKEKGFYDAIILNEKDQVTECSSSNLVVLRKNRLYTPPKEAGLLWGTTLEVLTRELGVEERAMTLRDLLEADSVFITNSLIGAVGVSYLLDRRKRVDGEVLKDMKSAIDKLNPPQGT